ncbi:MAG: flavin reductase family protein [Arcobacteraceae bacterium]
MVINYSELNDTKKYKLMSHTIIPRPIAWIVTQQNGIVNIAPFSYFAPLSSNPPLVVVSIGLKDDDTPKDTRINILETKKATICFAKLEHLEKLILSSNELPKDVSEAKEFDINTVIITESYPPIIENSQTALFCELHSFIDIQSETLPIILEIKSQYIQKGLCDEKLNIKVDNICRIGKGFGKIELIEL